MAPNERQPTMTPAEFAAKWSKSELKERAGYQAHWNDICAMLGKLTPTEYDLKGDEYCFEKGAKKADGSDGFADVWWRGKFAVEYKAPGKSLERAFRQLNDYRGELEQPPLMMVCDHSIFRIVTNFNNSRQVQWEFNLDDLAHGTKVDPFPLGLPPTSPFELLRHLFDDPDWFHPGKHAEKVTRDAAAFFAAISKSFESRPKARAVDPMVAAHFLMRCLFCLFAEDTGILKNRDFRAILNISKENQPRVQRAMTDLFKALASGGEFKYEKIVHVNGGLFNDTEAVLLHENEFEDLKKAAKLNWADVEPAIFGTLFERSLDPAQRKRLGAHYTSRADIMLVIEPVILRPLRREWDAIKQETESLRVEIQDLIDKMDSMGGDRGLGKKHAAALAKAQKAYAAPLTAFLDRLASIKVLDPACGSGNFLYVAMYEMKVLEAEVLDALAAAGMPSRDFWLGVHPRQFYGFEINEYAFELAQTVIWLGYLQWWRDHRGSNLREPVLDKLDTIQLKDALLERDKSGQPEDPPRMTEWPAAEFIIGNPPFLGSKLLRKQLGDEYMTLLQRRYGDRVSGEADLSVYWHERARQQIADAKSKRAGLLATQGIRGKRNRQTLEAVLDSGGIFDAWADREWTLDGAAVQISIVCQDDGTESERHLDGKPVAAINSDLTSRADLDLSNVSRLAENAGFSFMGVTKQGPFDIDRETAEKMWRSPNPHKRSNREVVRPWRNGKDLNGRASDWYLIDIPDEEEEGAALWEAPFEFVLKHVKPWRKERHRDWFRKEWWQLYARRPEFRTALGNKKRYIATTRVAKFRLFSWLNADVLPDSAVIAFARDDDYFFGVLHSTMHELWALRLGTQLEDRPRYTPTTCFETFPLPKPTKAQEKAIAAAARELNEKRENWLNPPELVAAAGTPTSSSATDDFMAPAKHKKSKTASLSLSKGAAKSSGSTSDPSTGSGNRKSKDVPGADLPLTAEQARKDLAKRTLTNLYNARPSWLHNLHVTLDKAVLAAYGWSDINVEHLHATRVAPMVGESKSARTATATECATLQKAAETEVLRRLLELNKERSA